MLTMQPVESTNVAAAGYDADTATLRITFRSGATYDYAAVPADLAAEFFAAESKGRFIGRIKSGFACARVTDPAPPPAERPRQHTQDEHCTVDAATGCCSICGVLHGDPCAECLGRGFHRAGCLLLADLVREQSRSGR